MTNLMRMRCLVTVGGKGCVLICALCCGLSDVAHSVEQETSPQYQAFVEFIGEEVELKGFSNFDGGLDTQSKTNEFFLLGCSLTINSFR